MLKAETWLQRSTYQIAPECLPTRSLWRVLHMDSLGRKRQTTCYCLGDLANLLCQGLADRPMGLKDCDKDRQLLRPYLTLVLCIGR